tara:strand:- start:407 stop:694 length:288 start_codon:yes stop_codon:yes gene_type:complete
MITDLPYAIQKACDIFIHQFEQLHKPREKYAQAALQGLMANSSWMASMPAWAEQANMKQCDFIAEAAFMQADSMIAVDESLSNGSFRGAQSAATR